jgi:hypothetical protein
MLDGSVAMRRATLTILATLLCLSWAAAEQAVSPPPRPLHKAEDGHWTPYEKATDVPADAELYVIQAGDTLWALAKKSLGDPHLWPQLWEKNKYIRDAHWIYPGDTLVVGVKKAAETGPAAAPATPAPAPTEAPSAAPPQEAAAETPAPAGGAGAPAESLVPAGSEDDVYCFAYLDEKESKPTFVVSSAEQIETMAEFSTGDIVYLSGGESEGIKAGQEFFTVLPVRKLRHPATHAVLGQVVHYIGHVRVLCTQEHTSTAEVLSSCDAIPLGAGLVPFEPMPIPMITLTPPLDRCDPASTKAKGYIIYDKDDVDEFGLDHVVMIDLGEADQIAPGTILTIFGINQVKGAPRHVLGELAVLTTGQHWATAKVIRSYTSIRVGDQVEVK